MSLPYLRLQMDMTGTGPLGTPTWTDYSSALRLSDGVSFNRGRADEREKVTAGSASFTLNDDFGTDVVGPFTSMPLRTWVRFAWSADGSTWVTLWTGFVSSRSRGWTAGVRPTVSVRCTDAVTTLTNIVLRSAVQSEILYDSPAAYYALDAQEGAASAFDATGLPGRPALTFTQLGTGGTADFGATDTTGPDPTTVLALTTGSGSYSGTNGWYMSAATGIGSGLGSTLEAVVRPSTTAQQMTAVAAIELFGIAVTLGTSSTGKARAVLVAPFDGVSVTLTGSSTLSTTASTHLALVQSTSGSTVTCTLYVNGSSQATSTYTRALALNLGDLYVGGTAAGDLWDGQLSHIAACTTALSAARVLAHSSARTGFVGERSDQRFTRLARWAGVTVATPGTGAATMGAQPTAGKSLWDALQDCADAESGTLYLNTLGQADLSVRGDRYNVTPAITLGPRDIAADTGFDLDDSGVTNDVTVSRPAGATVRAVDAASVASYGTREESLSIYVDTDVQVESTAQWLAHSSSSPAERVGSLSVECTAKAATVDNAVMAALDVGSVVTVDLASELTLAVEGLSDRFDASGWTRALNVSPVSNTAVWVLDSGQYSQLDSTTILAF